MSGSTSGGRQVNTVPTEADGAALRIPNETLDAALSKAIQDAGLDAGKARTITTTVVEMMTKVHQGPLPPAEDFAEYDRVHPGAAGAILDMAVRSQKHHYAMESRRQWFDFALNIIGMMCALGMVALMLYTSYRMVLLNQPWIAGVVLTCTGIASGVAVWLRSGTKSETISTKDAAAQRPVPRKKGRR